MTVAPHITPIPLISLISPISDTANQVLYVKKKQEGIGFTVSINQALMNDVKFNYWLIQTQP